MVNAYSDLRLKPSKATFISALALILFGCLVNGISKNESLAIFFLLISF